jgi:hypothetical protein
MPKKLSKAARAEISMPMPGESRTFEAESLDGKTAFLIDANRRGKIKLTRCSYLERVRVIDVLARLDVDGPPHTNPNATQPPVPNLAPFNGLVIPCPHYHFYVEGYDDRWAIPASEAGFSASNDLVVSLREFMIHCGVQDVPSIQYPIQ